MLVTPGALSPSDIDALLAQMALEDKKRTAVSVEEGCAPPSPRCNASVTAVELSAKRHELVIFGGEHYDGKKCRVYQDLYRYHIEKGVWYKVTSPGGPAARSAHVAGAYKSHVFVFGGEFTSPNQERFHHYKDLWRLDLETNKWEQIQVRGAPSPRSGHRAIVHKVGEAAVPLHASAWQSRVGEAGGARDDIQIDKHISESTDVGTS